MNTECSTDIKHLQKCELLIAKEIKRVCEKNNIQFFLVAGSLLGAIRHRGFIPWDDDMDVGMVRKDYNKFVDACKKDLGEDFFLQTWDNDSGYPFSYGKVLLKHTKVREIFSEESQAHKGIFVDVFPFDNAPVSKKEQERQAKKIFILRRALWLKKGYGKNIKNQGIEQYIKYSLSKFIFAFIPYSVLKRNLEASLKKYNFDNSEYLFMDSPYSYRKSLMERKWIDNLAEYEFEGIKLPGVADYDAYLRNLYGDYMTLPPLENREAHEILEVDFGEF